MPPVTVKRSIFDFDFTSTSLSRGGKFSAIKKYTEKGKIAYIMTRGVAGFEAPADRSPMNY
jgi:hypothetical protein